MHRDDCEDKHEELVDNEDVEDVFQRRDHTVENSLRGRLTQKEKAVNELEQQEKNPEKRDNFKMWHLQFRKPLDGFQRTQNSQNSKRLYCLDVSAFVVPVDVKVQHSGIKLYIQTHRCTRRCGGAMEYT